MQRYIVLPLYFLFLYTVCFPVILCMCSILSLYLNDKFSFGMYQATPKRFRHRIKLSAKMPKRSRHRIKLSAITPKRFRHRIKLSAITPKRFRQKSGYEFRHRSDFSLFRQFSDILGTYRCFAEAKYRCRAELFFPA